MTKQFDSSDEKQIADAKRRSHNDTNAEIRALCETMETKAGRLLIWKLLAKCHVYQSTFDSDNSFMCYREGAREIGLQYIAMLTDNCLDKYFLMHKENAKRPEDK